MKNLFLFALLLGLFTFASCGDDDAAVDAPEYHAHIHSPSADDKNVGDIIEVKIDFEEHNGETVHNIKVRMYNKATGTERWSKPDDSHVHGTTGMHTFNYTDTLNIAPHSDWIIEAKVWGDKDGLGEVIETVEFHVHP